MTCHTLLLTLGVICISLNLCASGGEDTLGCRTEVVFSEGFGSGAGNPGPPQPTSSITYCYEDLTGTCPYVPEITPGSIYDGSYSILNNPAVGLISPIDSSSGWIDMEDHTPGDTNGYMLVVNASFEPGEFFRLNDIAVIEGEPYVFSAWFANVLGQIAVDGCGTLQVPVNVNFVVEDAVTGTVLGSLSTGDIFGTGIANWVGEEFLFIASSPAINVVLANNGPGGCGNDFAIDDIRLTGCIGNTTNANDDEFAGCTPDGISGNVLDNDTDDEADAQIVKSVIIDVDGDLAPETEITTGMQVMVGGNAVPGGPVLSFGRLMVNADGQFSFIPEQFEVPGQVIFHYVIEDDGIPMVHDTATVVINVTCVPSDTLGCRTEVVFTDDFGYGEENPGPELPPGSTTYCYENLAGTCPSASFTTEGSINDGSYSIMNDPYTGLIFSAGDTIAWISTNDHTPDDTFGYMLVVNADYEPGEFYRLNNISVIPGEPYIFSAWFINILTEFSSLVICQELQVPVNVEFRVEDAQTGSLLGSVSSGDIFATGNSTWVQRGFLFTASSSMINIILVNNAPGGCGNDFAIDDISLIGCIGNSTIALDDNFTGCDEAGLSGNLLDNDSDQQQDEQFVVGLIYDSNGDGIPDLQAFTGEGIPLLDTNSSWNGPFGVLTLSSDGSFELVHMSNSNGYAAVNYIVCDSGIPVICDTAVAAFAVDCEVLPCAIPNYLSPNGDGLNDYFEIPCAPYFEDFELLIYNRWGNEVYKSLNGYQNDWDGTWSKNGEPLPDGTYFYIVRFNDVDRTAYTGDLLLLR